LTNSLLKSGFLERLPRLLLLEQPSVVKEMGLKALSVLCESGTCVELQNTHFHHLVILFYLFGACCVWKRENTGILTHPRLAL